MMTNTRLLDQYERNWYPEILIRIFSRKMIYSNIYQPLWTKIYVEDVPSDSHDVMDAFTQLRIQIFIATVHISEREKWEKFQ